MDQAAREKVAAPAFREAIQQKLRAVREALEAESVTATAPLAFYIGNIRVEADWSGSEAQHVARVRVGGADDPQAMELRLPAPWIFGAEPAQSDIDYLLAGNRPAT